jgi:hypothetical protein
VPIVWGKDGITGDGIWSGKYGKEPHNGPVVAATCKKCGAKLVSFTTNDKLEIGPFLWEKRPTSN